MKNSKTIIYLTFLSCSLLYGGKKKLDSKPRRYSRRLNQKTTKKDKECAKIITSFKPNYFEITSAAKTIASFKNKETIENYKKERDNFTKDVKKYLSNTDNLNQFQKLTALKKLDRLHSDLLSKTPKGFLEERFLKNMKIGFDITFHRKKQ